MNNNKTILVIGASGNQGNAVATNLLSDGWAVRARHVTRNNPLYKHLKKKALLWLKRIWMMNNHFQM